MKIGFIGQGWIGKHYADDFEKRQYDIVRYSIDYEYIENKEKISECDIVFIAVPTPTTPEGFDDSIVREVIKLVGDDMIAVIKSTIIPGATESIQKENPGIFVMHSPEFLREASAAQDAANPDRNVVGIPEYNKVYREKAQRVIDVLPNAPYEKIMLSKDAELVKYAGNCFLFMKVIYTNILYDLVEKKGGNWDDIKNTFIADPRIGNSHTDPVHKKGRGAGGHCFIKDFEAFREFYSNAVGNTYGDRILEAMKDENIRLLLDSAKDMDLLKGVYGDNYNNSKK